MKVEKVCWPVKRPGAYETRPAALISALANEGLLSPDVRYQYHGRPDPESEYAHRPLKSLASRDRSQDKTAVLSPFFLPSMIGSAVWVDLYDDWSLAPELGLKSRLFARASYRAVRRCECLVTVNSAYLAGKFADRRPAIVPNGVPASFGRHYTNRAGDDRRRLVLIGNFFAGRTDYDLALAMMRSTANDEVLVFAADARLDAAISKVNTERGTQHVRSLPKTPMGEIIATFGERTVVGIPHVVSDYTLSQDLMKAYQSVAAGSRFVLPFQLRPEAINEDYMGGIGIGADIDRTLDHLYRLPPLDAEEVSAFVSRNSWEARASRVMDLLS